MPVVRGSSTSFGRYQVAESPSALLRLHRHTGAPLKEVDHEPKLGVLDQEDLIAQGIDTSTLVPGAKRVDALGSCTAQATTVALSNVLTRETFFARTGCTSYEDTKGGEEFAIGFYHACTTQTGNPSTEWPPTDCGSSGPYIASECQRLGLVTSERIAHDTEAVVSLLQFGGVLVGQPFFNSWMEPDPYGFVDGTGSVSDLEQAIGSGVAGGHETYVSAIEKLSFDGMGRVDPLNTVLRVRNSWSASWGDHGSYRIHLSTYSYLMSHCDFRQLI